MLFRSIDTGSRMDEVIFEEYYVYEVPTLINDTEDQDGTTSFRVIATNGRSIAEIGFRVNL